VELIVTTTALLLDEVGFERFNTNLLAERANIRVRTIYRYFPNKYAIITALTRRLAVEWDRWESAFYEAIANPAVDWKVALRENRAQWMQNAQRVPGALSVLQAMNATPELIDLQVKMADGMAEKMARALKSRGSRLSAVHLMAIARTMVNSMNTGLDVSMRLTGTEHRHFVSEVLASQEAYLDLYLRDLGPAGSALLLQDPCDVLRPRRSR
jgi:AcrR family transcriptional regulator